MASIVLVQSSQQFTELLRTSRVVVADFYEEGSRTNQHIQLIYERLSERLSRPNQITFTKVDMARLGDVARAYEVSTTPTLVIFKNGAVTSKIAGADRDKISQVIVDLLREAGTDDDGGADSSVAPPESAWLGAEAPKGYVDVTDEVELNGIDLLNVDSSVGSARILFEKSKPSALAALETSQGKGKAKAESEGETAVDWIESDTDQQIMLFMPFEASLKIHSLQLTSLPPRSSPESSSSSSSSSTDEGPTRPKTVNVYSNRAYALGFEEAEDIPATQTIHIAPGDWDATTGTAALELRVVKFQKVTSLVVFVVDGEQDDADKVRIDRLRIIGEAGNERKMKGKLAKFGHESGE